MNEDLKKSLQEKTLIELKSLLDDLNKISKNLEKMVVVKNDK